VTVPFEALSVFGVTFDSLSPTQQAAINSRGGPGAATVVLQRDVNADGYLKINGLELSWVQPLDKILPIPGFGFSANYTRIKQKTTGGVSGAVALGVPETTYNVTGYYEQHGVMIRLSQDVPGGLAGEHPRTRTASPTRRSTPTTTSSSTCRRASTWGPSSARRATGGRRSPSTSSTSPNPSRGHTSNSPTQPSPSTSPAAPSCWGCG
jgi:hypothetical protein